MAHEFRQATFGDLLRFFRAQTIVRYTGSSLSQSEFGKRISAGTGLKVSRNQVSNWENGKTYLHPHNDRLILVSMLKILYQYGGIKTLDNANRLLEAGNYRTLNRMEIAQVNPDWQITDPDPKPPQVPGVEEDSLAALLAKFEKIPALTIKIATTDPLPVDLITHVEPSRRGMAPPVPSLVVGRQDDLARIKENLGLLKGTKPVHTVQILTAIRGWPGVGKTTLAAALAHDPDVFTAFPDGILWTSLGQTPNLLSEIAAWGRALGTDGLLHASSLEEASAQLRALLRHRKTLLIIDDVWAPEHAMPFNVGGHLCATILTTRLRSVADTLAPTPENVYWLPVLTDEKAFELLHVLAPKVVSDYPDETRELARELEGLPLALQVAGRLLHTEASYGLRVRDLIAGIRAGAALLTAKAPPDRTDLANQTTPTIAALLYASIERLDPQTRNCYAYLGVFAPKPATFDLKVMKAVWQVEDPKPFAHSLVERGLLEYIPSLERYQMHAVLVMHAKTLLEDVF